MADFNNNIPQPGDFLSDSQQDLLINNRALDEVYDRNHYNFSVTDATTRGKHKFIELLNRAALPAPATPLVTSSGTVYTKQTAGTGTSNLYYSNDDSGREYRLTSVVSNGSAAVAFPLLGTNTALINGVGGFTWLGQGVILQYGLVINPTLSPVTFPVVFTAPPFNIQLTPTGSGSTSGSFPYRVESPTVTANGFSITLNIGGSGFGITGIYWSAIGTYNG